jgi:hypothetical protein
MTSFKTMGSVHAYLNIVLLRAFRDVGALSLRIRPGESLDCPELRHDNEGKARALKKMCSRTHNTRDLRARCSLCARKQRLCWLAFQPRVVTWSCPVHVMTLYVVGAEARGCAHLALSGTEIDSSTSLQDAHMNRSNGHSMTGLVT